MNYSLVLFAVLSVVFLGAVLWLVVLADRQRRRHIARLHRLRPDAGVVMPAPRRSSFEKPAQNGIVRLIEAELAQTNLRVSVNELVVQVSVGVLGLYGVSVLLLGLSPLLAVLVAVLLPLTLAALVLRIAKARYRATFTENLPEALDVFARGLRAGRPVSNSLSIVVESSEGAILREFSRCHNEICMGTSLPESLARLSARIQTPEVSFFAVATALQAETGGNLIETMEGLANQLRARRQLRKKARALTSEVRASTIILASLPFVVLLAIGVLNAGYLEPLYNDPRGRIMAAAAVTSIGVGIFMMTRMGKLDV
ncbi:type II secretion system F family protein [Sulfitobacter sp.]|uniref:type II secretion system F family protein n=1 Tax=Sulfitobacter sp. TaxID=1903071 RepID=UPI003297C90C